MTSYIDISPPVTSRTAVFPGDVAYSREVHLDFAHGDNLCLSAVRSTVHIGAHADAPCHYHPGGSDIAARPLCLYVGPCQVLHVRAAPGERLAPGHLEGRAIEAPRVLFCTGSFPDPEKWRADFNALSPELIEVLAARDVRLVGIDTPSVDPADDPVLLSHQAIFKHDMAILEGLVLQHAPEGEYHLTALPLRLEGADASPVRAVLWKT